MTLLPLYFAPPVVDIHSHLYPPTYMSVLRTRTTPPLHILLPPPPPHPTLINRPSVPGKPVLPSLTSPAAKLAFMDAHNISASILSLGNPWLDFLTSDEERAGAGDTCRSVNKDMQSLCAEHTGRLWFFAALPVTAGVGDVLTAIAHLRNLSLCRGGLDDNAFLPVLRACAESALPVFLHPNYGLPGEVFGPCCGDHGQVLPVSLGFTTETTVAVARMYLAGVGLLRARLAQERKTIWDVLRQNVYLDGIVFDKIPLWAAAEAVGSDRLMFGTDHPLFPNLSTDGLYDICVKNQGAARDCFGEGSELEGVMGGNAVRVFNLQ
ncbi:hypothetical protein EJ04DRAFT_536141 [Polyplosphaeria fusca]|uniref:Amidohydrolase-related domain-containing protein n=1 Tax=Polyplosphaeria fusca TaxID=682080 RepID=A0A9P4QW86_9PLEO|nr:hypothetical protein EJ04DRAFT_536141 [Polyplosphaeria fusca]